MSDDRTPTPFTGPPAHARTTSSLPAIGPVTIVTGQGIVDLDEVGGTTTILATSQSGDRRIVIANYGHPDDTGGRGRGLFAQVTPDVARQLAASLLKMAADIDPKGTN